MLDISVRSGRWTWCLDRSEESREMEKYLERFSEAGFHFPVNIKIFVLKIP
jgi:hypothetical protein